jgi:beta-phosphoglucomutase-like phosphatase (HAD superfamily)
VRAFLASRAIVLPQGAPSDPPHGETIDGLGNRKNELVLELIASRACNPTRARSLISGPQSASGCVRRRLLQHQRRDVLTAAEIAERSEVVIDGGLAERDHLAGKPAPNTFLAGARALGLEPAQRGVFEDALAGVQAGRAGRFGVVIGVDRVGQPDALRADGAKVVVGDLAELLSS